MSVVALGCVSMGACFRLFHHSRCLTVIGRVSTTSSSHAALFLMAAMMSFSSVSVRAATTGMTVVSLQRLQVYRVGTAQLLVKPTGAGFVTMML